jgi:hypothetical protein
MTGSLRPADPEQRRWPHPGRAGLVFGIASYGIWGLVPIFSADQLRRKKW